LHLNEDIDEIQAEQIEDIKSDIDVWGWEQEFSDWLNSSGEFLTGCKAYERYKILRL
jgi:methionine synthase II (cobalamin-independent)